jgi:uncharacterized FlgJ-related protein
MPSMYDEEISKLRDAPQDAQTTEMCTKLPPFDTNKSSLYRTQLKKLYHQFHLPDQPTK